ncbi:MAG: VCBS repeat-containing protein [Saprospiraceae bacterium]|nr:VCBS repeat-containing protein [Saprospiraceae bacterium]
MVLVSTLLLCFCGNLSQQGIISSDQYQVYCGQCHQAPDPTQLPKDIWANHIMPEMAKIMKVQGQTQGPLDIFSMEESLFAADSSSSQRSMKVDQETWAALLAYLDKQAPDKINVSHRNQDRNEQLVQFTAQPLRWNQDKIGNITSIVFDEPTQQFTIGDAKGNIHYWPDSSTLTSSLPSPVLHVMNESDQIYITEVGYLDPSDAARGSLHRWHLDQQEMIIEGLQRPVFSKMVDLDQDGQSEILICEFGNHSGKLSLWSLDEGKYRRSILLNEPGTIKVDISDMNRDGKDDIIVLASQAREGIYILYQENNLQFETKQVIRLEPQYGSSWFELIDYNGDEHLDIVIANGDNADYSIISKPFHGLRLYINDGKDQFTQTWFYPIFGATRVCANDYDLDGDIDFAVMSFFPDYDIAANESFVYLENINAKTHTFKSHTTRESALGRWLVMDDGDYDGDGDLDILLGSFLLPVTEAHQHIMEYWQRENVHLMLLKNEAVTN